MNGKFFICFLRGYFMDTLLEQCEKYNADEDPSGAIGRALEERFYQRTGSFHTLDTEQLELWKEIAFRKFPPLLGGETILVREFKQRFSELRKAGYDIKPYSKLTKKEARNYLREIKRDITS